MAGVTAPGCLAFNQPPISMVTSWRSEREAETVSRGPELSCRVKTKPPTTVWAEPVTSFLAWSSGGEGSPAPAGSSSSLPPPLWTPAPTGCTEGRVINTGWGAELHRVKFEMK